MSKLLEVIIDRSKWDIKKNRIALEDYGGAKLLNERTGLMCCIGFVGKVCRVQGMKGMLVPIDCPSKNWPKGLLDVKDGSFLARLINANDAQKISDSKRESRITKWGKRAGINFKFVGKFLEVKHASN